MPTGLRSFLAGLVPAGRQGHAMGLLALVQALGAGAFVTSSTVFLTTVAGFAPGELAAAWSVAGLAGFLATVPAGRLADRVGPGLPLAAGHLVAGAGFVLYAAVTGVVELTAVAGVLAVCEISGSPLRAALARSLFGQEGAVRVRAQMRSLFNVGFSAGAGLAVIALAAGTRDAFVDVLLGTAACQLVCAATVLGLKGVGTRGRPDDRAWRALRDRRYVAVTVVAGLLELFQPVLNVGLPLWLVHRLHAARPWVAAPLVVNTVLVAVLQPWASRGATTATGSARLLRRGGLLLSAACVVLSLTAWLPGSISAGTVLAAAVVLTLGEVFQAAGAWGLSFFLAPDGRTGEYQGVFALGRGIQQFLGPALVTSLVVGPGAGGWLVLAVGFAVVAAVAGAALVPTPSSGANPTTPR